MPDNEIQDTDEVMPFSDAKGPLPAHLLYVEAMIREKASLARAMRFTTSNAARTNSYECLIFHKHISRSVRIPQELLVSSGGSDE